MKLLDAQPLDSATILTALNEQAPFAAAQPAATMSDSVPNAVGGQGVANGESELFAIKSPAKSPPSSHPVQVVLHGCPGSGKSHTLKEWSKSVDYTINLVFHPEMTYADFVGVYRPKPVYRQTPEKFTTAAGADFGLGEPYVTYEFVPGPFLDAYCIAMANPDHIVALVIEELSRANASLVFGDMLQLLDRLDQGPEVGVSTYEILPKPEIREYLAACGIHADSSAGMRLPSNLFIWATMNRSDQNARQLDAAFLRRWAKLYLSHRTASTYGQLAIATPEGPLEWDELRKRINEALLNAAVTEDKFIGPYFLGQTALAAKERVAQDLLGYLWNDVLRTRARDFFKPEMKSLAEVIEAWATGTANPFSTVSLKSGVASPT